MYGLILEGIAECLRKKYGDEAWNRIRVKAGITHTSFGKNKTLEQIVPYED